jgi:hypothetical protein
MKRLRISIFALTGTCILTNKVLRGIDGGSSAEMLITAGR